MSSLVFTTDKSVHLGGKQGKLPKDSDGFYEVLAGAYNATNNIGETYVFTEKVRNLFTKSTMMENLKLKQLFGEADHPDLDVYRVPGRKEAEAIAMWLRRLGRVDTKNAAMVIDGVRFAKLDKTNMGKPVYGVFIKIKPLMEGLRISLDDPNQNTAFSVRSFINRAMKLGQMFCEAKDLITYDWVTKGGIAEATKYGTPGLESYERTASDNGVIITTDIAEELHKIESMSGEAGLESDSSNINSLMVRNLAGSGWQSTMDLGDLVSRNW